MAGEWSTFMGGNFDNFAPVARFEDLVTTESGNELLIFDTRNAELHHLDQLSTLVWRHLDGSHTVSDLVVIAKSESANVTDESIRLTIAALGNISLLASDIPEMVTGVSQSRRRFLKKAAIAGAAVPVIASITMPAAHASTLCTVCSTLEVEVDILDNIACCDGDGNIIGVCVGLPFAAVCAQI
jgi:hypothetical protein